MGVERLEHRCLLTTPTITEFPTPTANGGPYDIAAGPDGALWFTELYGNKIGRIDPTTHDRAEFPVPTINSAPWSITAGPDGAVWFTENGGNKIGRIDPNTHHITESTIPTALSFPQDITAGPDGNLWFTEPETSKIGRITTAGVITEFTVGTSFGSNPITIAAGPDGNLWFSEQSGRIGRITTAGVVNEFAAATGSAAEITPGPDGNLWFTEDTGNRIGRITPAGVIEEFPVSTAGSQPWGITAGADGALWFTERQGNNIGRIDPTTHGITEISIPTAFSDPVGITAGTDGNLWFTEGGFISKIGQVTLSFIEFPTPTASGGPHDITTGPGGNLWFTEENGNRIARISPTTFAITEYPIPVVGSDASPAGITLGPDGKLWFAEDSNNRIGVINPENGHIDQFPAGAQDSGTMGITKGPDGKLWYTDVQYQSRIGVIDPDSHAPNEFSVGDFLGPASITLGPDHGLWFTGSDSDKIREIDPTTHSIAVIPIPTSHSSPYGITTGPDGAVWFTEENASKIGRIDPTTHVVTEFATPTFDSFPQEITAGPDGNLWFTEGDGNKIARINPTTHVIAEYPLPTADSAPLGITGGPDGNLWFTERRGAIGVFHIAYERLVPDVPVLSPQDDSGASSSDGITQHNGSAAAPFDFTVGGVNPPNGFVRLYDGTTLLAGPVQAVNGLASFAIAGTPLPDGLHPIAATQAATATGPESSLSPVAPIRIWNNVHILATSPSDGALVTSFVHVPPVTITFNHYLAGLNDGGPAISAAHPFAVMLLPRGPDGVFAAPSRLDSGDLPLHVDTVYHVHADGTSEIDITPTTFPISAPPLSTDVYLISVNLAAFTDLAGNPLTDPGGGFRTFLFQPQPFVTAPLRVTGVMTDTDVPVDHNAIFQPATIAISFNKPLFVGVVAGANAGNVQLIANPGPQFTVVRSASAYNPTTDTIYLTPEAPLQPGTVYAVRVDHSVSDDQGFGHPGFPLGQDYFATFTMMNAPTGPGQSPLRVVRNAQEVASTVPLSGSAWHGLLGFASVTFTEPVSLASLGRYSAVLTPRSGGLNDGAFDVADVPVNAKLAFNPNTNQLIIVPTQVLGEDIYLITLRQMDAANADGSPNTVDPLTDPGGLPIYFTFQLFSLPLPGSIRAASAIVAGAPESERLRSGVVPSPGGQDFVVNPGPAAVFATGPPAPRPNLDIRGGNSRVVLEDQAWRPIVPRVAIRQARASSPHRWPAGPLEL